MDLSSLDFQQARIKLVLFKSRLRSVLYGVRTAEPELFSPQHNPLSDWLRTVLRPRYGHHQELADIERHLQLLLSTGQDLAAQYQRGQIEEARAGLGRIDTHADQITRLLQLLETREEQLT